MGLFITTKQEATRHDVYAIERPRPALITPTGTGVAALVEQFPWGPSQTLVTPEGKADLISTIAPPGMSRTGAGYLAIIRKAFPLLKFLRVLGSAAATASATINKTGPAALVVVALKYAGTAGNGVVITTTAATDGDANHFNIVATVTGVSGTTTETIHNWNVSGTGADSAMTAAQIASLKLIGSVTKSSAGVPILGSTTCSGGTDGTIGAAQYVGTAGTDDAGLARLEGDRAIDHVFVGDPGNSARAAVNAGLKAHVDLTTDRVAYINGNSAQTSASARSDATGYQSQRVVYCDPWVWIQDDVTLTRQLVPSAAFFASVASRLPASTSIGWKSDIVGTMLEGIVDLETLRGGDAVSLNTKAGVATLIKEETGGFRIEAGVTTIAPASPAKRNLTRTRMGIFIARSVKQSLRPQNDQPNLPIYQQDVVDAVTSFMERLKKNATKEDAVLREHVLNYGIGDLEAENPQAELDEGDFSIPLDAKISSSMERIFLNINYGETVQITAS